MQGSRIRLQRMAGRHHEVINSGNQNLETARSWTRRWRNGITDFGVGPLQKSSIWRAGIKQLNNVPNAFLDRGSLDCHCWDHSWL